LTRVGAFAGNGLLGPGNRSHRRSIVWECNCFGCWELRKPAFKGVLHELGVGCHEPLFGGECLLLRD
jgi:hypothetical protein